MSEVIAENAEVIQMKLHPVFHSRQQGFKLSNNNNDYNYYSNY